MSDQRQEWPDDSKKVVHVTIDSFKMNAKIYKRDKTPMGKTGKGVKIVCDDRGESIIVQIPEAIISGNGLKMPDNAVLRHDLDKISEAFEEDMEATLEYIKQEGFWKIRRIQEGHIGQSGVVKPGAVTVDNKGGRSGYDPSGPIIGKLENWAISFAMSKVKQSTDFDDVLKMALEALEEADSNLVAAINSGATKLYKSSYQVGEAGGGAAKSKAKPKAKEIEEDEDEEEEEESPPTSKRATRKPKPKPKPRVVEEEEDEGVEGEILPAGDDDDLYDDDISF